MILGLYLLGLVTWLLTLGRSAAWDARHTALLAAIVMTDELLGIGAGMYLARSGTWLDAVACAAGGATAAVIVMFKRGKR